MRALGKRIIEALEAVEMYGPCGCAVVSTESRIEVTNASKYCQRAVRYGLMTVVKPVNRGQNKSYALYSVVPGWRGMLKEQVKTVAPRELSKERQRPRTVFSGISSIFNMGAA
jgi:hypothetical protein